MLCTYCGLWRGHCDSACPDPLYGNARTYATALWQAGYGDGHSGQVARHQDSHYTLGFLRGYSAALQSDISA